MKIKNIGIGLASAALLLVASCSLDYDPVGGYSEVTEGVTQGNKDSVVIVIKDKAEVNSIMENLNLALKNGVEHWVLDMHLFADIHSDNSYGGTTGAECVPAENNSINASYFGAERAWNRFLGSVASANNLINNIDAVPDPSLTAAERSQYKAQAKILRAMVYFDMVRLWGDVPLITTTVSENITADNVEEMYFKWFPTQATELDVYKQIEQDCLDALADGGAPNVNPTNKMTYSKSVARMLLAKVYAEKPLRDYEKVITYVDQLTADGFQLADKFNDLFGVVLQNPDAAPSATNLAVDGKRNSVETIYEAQWFTGGGGWLPMMFGRFLNNWNQDFTWAKWCTPSRDLIAAYEKEGDTERLNETVVWYSCNWSNYYPKDNYPFMYKLRSAYSSVIKYRYADALLLKAEALIQLGRAGEAAPIINQIRARAGLAPISGTPTIDVLLKERRLELAYEGQRWFDLVRLDKVEEVMNTINSKDSGRLPQVNRYNEDSYRWPIPQTILDQNPNLKQNPSY